MTDRDTVDLTINDPVRSLYLTDEEKSLFRALLAAKEGAEAERDEARRRRDEWRKKAEGYDEVRRALREKVGEPWPPNMSRLLWASIAADEKKRAEAAEAKLSAIRPILHRLVHGSEKEGGLPFFGVTGQRMALKVALDVIGKTEGDIDE